MQKLFRTIAKSESGERVDDYFSKRSVQKDVLLPKAELLTGVDLINGTGNVPAVTGKHSNDELSREFFITNVSYIFDTATQENKDDENLVVNIPVNIQVIGEEGLINETITHTLTAADITAAPVSAGYTATGTNEVKDTLTFILAGKINFETAKLTLFTSDNNLNGVYIRAYLSELWNNTTMSTKTKMKVSTIKIDDSYHLSAEFPEEYRHDMEKVHSLNVVNELTENVTDTFAHTAELEGYQFLKDSFTNHEAGLFSAYKDSFNCYPPAEFAQDPQKWWGMLKNTIEYICIKMRTDNSYPGGMFTLIGHPLDTRLIGGEITWSYKQNDSRDGITSSYAVGVYKTAAGDLNVVASDYAKQGEMRIIYIPNADDLHTYKYFPYTFNLFTSKDGYRSPKGPSCTFINSLP